MSVVLSEHLPLLASAPDGIQKLRGLILELAVRGKLVPQDPDDEPASELLKRIAQERAHLEAKGVVKKSKAAPFVDEDEQSFSLPEGWQWVRLATIGNIFNGNSINSSEKDSKFRRDDGLPYIATKDVGYGLTPLDYENGVRIPESERSFKMAKAGAVFICAEGGSAGKKCGLCDRNVFFGNKLFANEAYAGIPPRLVLYIYLSPFFRKQFTAVMTGIIGGVSIAKFIDIPIPLPPLAEQHRIVAKVDELMALCDQLEAEQVNAASAHARLVETLLGTLTQSADATDLTANWQRLTEHFDTLFTTESSIDALKQTILQLAVMGKLVPQTASDEPANILLERIEKEKSRLIKDGIIKRQIALPEISEEEINYQAPNGWEWCRFQNVTRLITDGKHGDCNNSPNSGYYFLSAKDIQNGELIHVNARQIAPSEFEEVHQRTNLQAGDICMVNTGATVGKLAIAPDNELTSRTTFQKSVAVIKVASPFISPRYIALFLQAETPKLREKSGGSAINNLLLGDLKKKLVPIPPTNEQHRIVAKVDELMTFCDCLQADLAIARQREARLADTLIESALEAA